MGLILPARSYTTVVYFEPSDTAYGLLGPFFEGTVLAEVLLHCIADAAAVWGISFSVGGSAEASIGALRSGVSIIERSPGTLGDQPILNWVAQSEQAFRFRIPVGVRVHSGSRYLVFGVTAAGLGVKCTTVVSARMVEANKESKAKGEG